MWLPLLPLLTLVTPALSAEPARAAQIRLVETLVTADSIDAVRAEGVTITFAIDRAGEAYDVVATTSDTGEIVALSVSDAGHATSESGGLTWLGAELTDARAITTLIAADGNVTLVTADDRYIRAMAGHAPNVAVEARWAAAWDSE
jgi:hypothetical protein